MVGRAPLISGTRSQNRTDQVDLRKFGDDVCAQDEKQGVYDEMMPFELHDVTSLLLQRLKNKEPDYSAPCENDHDRCPINGGAVIVKR